MNARMQKHRMTCWLGRLVAALLLVLFATASPARAAVESVAPVPDGGIWLFWDPSNLSPPTSSPDVACNSGYNAQWMPGNGYVYVGSVPNQYGYAGLGYRDCIFKDNTGRISGGGSIQRVPFPPVCPVPTVNPTVPYSYNVTSGMCERTAQETCPIPSLTPLTDPVAIDFENGTRWRPDGMTAVYQEHLRCVETAITARGGSSVGTSAYRPTQYQQHLFEIVKKDYDLDTKYMTSHPECQALRDEITRVMGPPPGHGLKRKQKVAPPGSSRHESGTAFDLTPSRLTDAQMTLIYAGCGVTHTAVSGEPWHVQ